jgi:hypothetical protein
VIRVDAQNGDLVFQHATDTHLVQQG